MAELTHMRTRLQPDDIENVHYSDNDSDTYCDRDLDAGNTIYTDVPTDTTCPVCLAELRRDNRLANRLLS